LGIGGIGGDQLDALAPRVEPEAIRETLGLTEDLWPIVLLPLGHPAEQPAKPTRRRIQDVIREI
jgi:nitroreductase